MVTLSCSLIYCIKLNSKLTANRKFRDGHLPFCFIINLMTMTCLTSLVAFQLACILSRGKNLLILFILNLHRRLGNFKPILYTNLKRNDIYRSVYQYFRLVNKSTS